eukprot:scaffold33593_cov17-Prasinocladus_malaysianus.AAC.1
MHHAMHERAENTKDYATASPPSPVSARNHTPTILENDRVVEEDLSKLQYKFNNYIAQTKQIDRRMGIL